MKQGKAAEKQKKKIAAEKSDSVHGKGS